MRKIIAAINMTLDGFCDHTAGIADDELHHHYSELLKNAGVLLYGRKTFELMKYWQNMVANPSGVQALDEFAATIDKVPMVVFSRTLLETGWQTATLAKQDLEKTALDLKLQPGKYILAGSPSMIVQLTQLRLIDEYQLCIHPVILGEGLTLFKNISDKIMLRLKKAQTFNSGAITLYYEPVRQ